MKKCLNIFLIITISLNTSGYIFLYLKQQHDIKKEMFRKIAATVDITSLTKITLTKTSFPEWNTEKEIKYKGSLYDVVKKEDNGKYVILYCINDKKEEEVIKNFSKHVDDLRKNTNSKRTIAQFSFTAVMNSDFTLLKENDCPGNIILYRNNYESIIKHITSPPPKFSFI